MTLRNSVSMVLTGCALVAPAVARAQATASVTVGPVGVPAPALDVSLLIVLALTLTIVTVVKLRRLSPAVRAAAIAFAISMTAIAAHSTGATVLVTGGDCGQTTTEDYTPEGRQVLGSECAETMRILDLRLECDNPGESPGEQPLPSCEIGLELEFGDECFLPTCDT